MNDAQRPMMYDAGKKSALVAYLFWFLFGSFGVHRFYAGKTGSAIVLLILFLLSWPLMLVLVGIFTMAIVGLWVLIDALLIPGMIRELTT
jgi:TM2 domain-containing membrane protein YozV